MLSGKIFDIPCFDWKRYLEIYRSNISIVAELCYGGILSNHLGLPFNSPFVNVRVESPEYWKMINKINEYMSISPKIKQIGKRDLNEQFLAGCIEYPLLQYDDIFLHGFHYESEQYFLCKWEQRRERFNPQLNIICKILYDEEDIDNFDKLRADTKLGFYYEELNVENIITVPFDKHFYSYSFAGCVQEFIKSKDIFSRVDIFKLLLGESGFKR